MDWDGLERLGPKFMDLVRKHYGEPQFLYFALQDENDARGILQDAYGELDSVPLGDEAVHLLLEWKRKRSFCIGRHMTLRCNDSFKCLVHPGRSRDRSIQDEFEEIVKESPSYILDLAKRRLKRKRESKGVQRAELENEQRKVYALQLAELIQEAALPVTFQICMLPDPNKAWLRIFGSRRSKTLRNRLRSWQKFRSWFVAFSGEVWPKHIGPLIAYVEERIDDGCSFSCPSELHAALSVLEQIGRVPEDKRCSNDSTWMSHMASWKLELENGTRVPRQAKPYTMAILVSLEILVLDSDQDIYSRFIAWTMLVACWTSLRVDDIQNILPETLRL